MKNIKSSLTTVGLLIMFSCCLLNVLGQQSLTKDKYIVGDDHKIRYQSGGSGASTVVFECGFGDDIFSWEFIYPEVAKFSKVLRYDREGYGLSEVSKPTSQPKNFKDLANKLHELLKKANAVPPYIFVNHSMGGGIIRAYAFLYPNEIAGLVFVDPFNEYEMQGRTQEQIDSLIESSDAVIRQMPLKSSAEWEIGKKEILNGFPELNSFGPLPDIPTVVIAAGTNGVPGVRNFYENKICTLSEAYFIQIAHSQHYVHNYEPSLVIENIKRVVFPSLDRILRKIIRTEGMDSCVAKCLRLREIYPKDYISESYFNSIGYEELQQNHINEAVKLFSLYVTLFPESSNAYDSLGEAYLKAGNEKEAIKNYKKSLSINPENTHAKDVLKKLK